ncbi:MAG: DUF2099 family protein [Actinobacteria bacterium]|nr:DUF2099 family protein [Actinomycetota bacterium]
MALNKLNSFLKEIKKDNNGTLPRDLHITRKAGALVAISGGKVIKIQKPDIFHCPLFTSLFSYKDLNQETIGKKFEKQISMWGMFTGKRHLCDDKIIVPFGASEMMMYALKRSNIDSAVVACEGAGTVISSNPSLIQGIGAYMNGLFYTTPIPGVIKNINNNGGTVLSGDALMDPYKGVVKAIEMGHKKIAVTVRGDQEQAIKKIRALEEKMNSNPDKTGAENAGNCKDAKTGQKGNIKIIILAVCNTGIKTSAACTIRDFVDLAWACASKQIRDIVGSVSILQVGMKIPVFITTLAGLDFISSYSSDSILKEKLEDKKKKHFITSGKSGDGAIKINMGKFSVFLYETEKLPLGTEDEPFPLI